ncbi:MAG: Flp family type IVb pilin [Actinoplanes sp.]
MPYLSLLTLLFQDLRTKMRSEEGASAVEYGLLVSLIAAAIVGLVAGLGTRVGAIFSTVTTKI